jgi:hypothetical protein
LFGVMITWTYLKSQWYNLKISRQTHRERLLVDRRMGYRIEGGYEQITLYDQWNDTAA